MSGSVFYRLYDVSLDVFGSDDFDLDVVRSDDFDLDVVGSDDFSLDVFGSEFLESKKPKRGSDKFEIFISEIKLYQICFKIK